MSKQEIEAIEDVFLSEDIPEQPFIDMREIAQDIPFKTRLAQLIEWREAKRI